ncbi:MAG: gamma-glutamylcyclotransferase [Cyanobacteria bacterium P01_F01_bin.33]
MSETSSHSKRFFICGSALRGQPDHENLGSAQFVRTAVTQPRYRLHAAADGWHPAIYEVATGGIAIPGEVYLMTVAQYEYLLANEPPNMYPGELILDDGSSITAMLYPRELVEEYNWPDISDLGGWAAYKTIASPTS